MKILIVDDEKLLVKGIKFNLENEGYEVDAVYNGEDALALAQENDYDLIVLDLMLPKMDGLEVCRRIREFSKVPVVMLTAKGEDTDKLLGFEYGADDYIAKPFGVMEMIARVKALLRRSGGAEESLMTCGNVTLDSEKRMVYVDGKPVELTYKEFELLKLLMKNHGIVISRDVIMERVWDSSFEGESRTIDVHVRTLRQKLGDGGALIKTIRNVGYMAEAK